MKLSELCKTRSMKSSPDIFNLYVVLTSHDTVTDVGRAFTFGRNFYSPLLQTKSTKSEGPSEYMGFFTENQFEDCRRKKEQKQYSRLFRKNLMDNEEPYRYQSIMALINNKS